ncbi:MAG: DNA polymerase III subunit gamma/tau [Oceanospirillaceae bacterium]|nr:DNA polymerase III subunit gamma/tau [Oceanospirillaceae bacterium]HCI01940.1 DNA polymerase III subunit gamma/tau [Oceanospirillaceae bacterium]
MAYQVLARKWRPQDFHSLVGQEHVLRALIHALDEQRLHHAYLFAGTRGVGKTTIARILARCLNCEEGVTSTPCGVCSSCQEISEGRFVDLIEVDAASRTKVEDTRELLENVQYAPTRGRYKVYLIDEVHMLSTSSFNALLKTLEEPPPHVIFLLATTDPQKLPITVLSRCLQFNLKNMSAEQIAGHLRDILSQEQIACDEASVWQLGRAAKGSMRDALSLTDQAIAYCGGELSESAVNQMLGSIDQGRVVALVQALQAGDGKAILAEIAELAEQGQDFVLALEDLLSLLHQIAISQVVAEAPVAVQFDQQVVQTLAQTMSAADVQLFYQMGSVAHKDLPLAPDIRNGFEMALLRMLAFRPQLTAEQMQTVPTIDNSSPTTVPVTPATSAEVAVGVAETSGVQAESESKPEPKPEPEPEAKVAPESELKSEAAPKELVESTPEPSPELSQETMPIAEQASDKNSEQSSEQVVGHVNVGDEQVPVMADIAPWDEVPSGWQGETVAASPEPIAEVEDEQAETSIQNAEEPPLAPAKNWTLADLDENNWPTIFRDLQTEGLTRSIAANMVFSKRVGTQLTFTLEEAQSSMLNATHQGRIRQALEAMFGCDLQLAIDIGQSATETPFAQRERRLADHQQEAVEALQGDPYVEQLEQTFNGQLDLSSVKPVQNFKE